MEISGKCLSRYPMVLRSRPESLSWFRLVDALCLNMCLSYSLALVALLWRAAHITSLAVRSSRPYVS